MMDFKIGDRVIFGRENGQKREGVVTKINTKTLKITCEGVEWRVSPQLVENLTNPTKKVLTTPPTPTPSLKRGDKVSFTFKGKTIIAYVVRVSRKSVRVIEFGVGEYRVPHASLSLA